MGETKWTEEQFKAINTRQCNLLVAAAAGSGKTAVLVERIIKMITNKENPVDIDRLLVVTFTNAAAAEMRERIAVAISRELDKTPDSKNLQRQLTLLNRANITTMHSFCLDVIKNNYHKIDLDPSFRIGDQTEGILLKAEVMEELFEEKYDEDNRDFIDLVEIFNSYKNDDNLKELIINLYNFVMSGPWPEQWLKDSAEAFNLNSIEELDTSKWAEILKESIAIEVNGYIKTYDKAIDMIRSTDGFEPYLDNFLYEKELLEGILRGANTGLDYLYKQISEIKFPRLKAIKKDNVSDEHIQVSVKKIRDDIKKGLAKLNEDVFISTPQDMYNNIKKTYPYIKTLAEIVVEFSERFAKKKREKNILDFNDLEHFCLNILIDKDEKGNIIPSQIAKNFREYFNEVLVDEYQDSNNIQETIIDLISRKYLDNPNVFMVGDVKQSIYRFRQAEPELFMDKYNKYKDIKDKEYDSSKNKKITLYKNFRSRKEIIDGVNYIFKMLMSRDVGELDYDKDEFLNLGADYKISDSKDMIMGGPIEINIIDKSNQALESEDIDEEIDNENIDLEAKVVVKEIKNLMNLSREGKFKVLDKQIGEYRPVQYRDIVILFRATKNVADTLVQKLGEEDIPVYADTGTGYFQSIEIRTIMSLLKIIDNPMQDIPLIAILKSPITGFTAEELVDLRLIDKEKYIYENIISVCNSEENEQLKTKCKDFVERLNNWRRKAIYMPIDEFIWYLYMDTAYYGFVGSMPNGMLRQANLKVLFQKAKQFEETSFKGLFNFINFINKLIKSSGDIGSAKILGENEDVIRIMSIHKSKGLEFPVVFLCGMGKQFNLMDLNKNLLYHQELGFGPQYVNIDKRLSITTIAKEAIKKKIKFETLSEEMRILYVALTRAKEKLYMIGCVNNLEKSLEKWYNASILDNNKIISSQTLKAKSYIDWIGMAMCKHNASSEMLNKYGFSCEHLKDYDSKWKINILNKNILIEEKKEENQEHKENFSFCNKINNKVYEKIDSILSYKYKYYYSTTLKSNISVSELKTQNNKEYNDTYDMFKEKSSCVPEFLKETNGLSGSQRGTIVHLVMKNIDLNRVETKQEIDCQIKEMVNNELLSSVEAKVVNTQKIYNFFISRLGKLLLESFKFNEQNVYREMPFYTRIPCSKVSNLFRHEAYAEEKIRVQGIIDCFFIYKDKVILLDYKTDYVERDENELVDKYSKQLQYYSDSIYKLIKKKVDEKYLYSFYLDKEIEIK